MRLGQGRDNARSYLEQNPEIADEIDERIRERLLAERAPAEEEVGKSNKDSMDGKASGPEPIAETFDLSGEF